MPSESTWRADNASLRFMGTVEDQCYVVSCKLVPGCSLSDVFRNTQDWGSCGIAYLRVSSRVDSGTKYCTACPNFEIIRLNGRNGRNGQ